MTLTRTDEEFLFMDMDCFRFRVYENYNNLLELILNYSQEDKKPNGLVDKISTYSEKAQHDYEWIALSNVGLVSFVLKKLVHSDALINNIDYFINEGNYKLMTIIDKFDYRRGYKFSTYAVDSLKKHFYRTLKREDAANARKFSIDDDNNKPRLKNLPVSPQDRFFMEESLLIADLKEIFSDNSDNILTQREKYVLKLRYCLIDEVENEKSKSQTLGHIGSRIGVTREGVRQIEKKGFKKA